jgi:hypothetical protein
MICKVLKATGRLGILAAALGLLVVSGCGSNKATLSGKVTYNGKTLGTGTVTFFGGKDGKQLLASTTIDNEGAYSVKLPPGSTTITVETVEPEKSAMEGMPKPKDMLENTNPGGGAKPGRFVAIPAKYKDPNQSGIKYDVKSGVNKYAIELKD